MQLEAAQQDLPREYLGHFISLIGDKRTGVTFREIIKGRIPSVVAKGKGIYRGFTDPLSEPETLN